jgi:hypothetical protein
VAAVTCNTSTYNGNHAAISWVCWTALEATKRIFDSNAATDVKADAARDVEWYLDALEAIDAGCPVPQDYREKRCSKRQSLRGLPKDWRKLLPQKLTAHHRPGYWLTALCGCRPAELKKGVRLQRFGNVLQVTIVGSKVTADAGHKERRQEWDLDGGNDFVDEVIALMKGESKVTVKALNGFSRAIKDAGKRIWPRHKPLSAYSLRHAISSDLKADDWTQEEIALFLGHAVTKTQSAYGASRQGGGGGAVGLRSVSGSRPVRDNSRPPPKKRGPRML